MYFTHYAISYDIANAQRLSKLVKILKEYCFHQQYSLYEGELTLRDFREMKCKIHNILNLEKDSVIIYPLGKENIFAKIVMGTLKYRISRIW